MADDLRSRFLDGEREAVATVSATARRVIAFRAHRLPRGERDDLVQEVVLHVFRAASAPDFRLRQDFEAFVRVVAHRRCIDQARQHRWSAELPLHLRSGSPGPDREVLGRDMLRHAAKRLRALSFACAQLIRLRVLEGLPYREIAERLDRTEGSVRVHLHKCLGRARSLLESSEV